MYRYKVKKRPETSQISPAIPRPNFGLAVFFRYLRLKQSQHYENESRR